MFLGFFFQVTINNYFKKIIIGNRYINRFKSLISFNRIDVNHSQATDKVERLLVSGTVIEHIKQKRSKRYGGSKQRSIILLGLTVHNIPVNIREKFAIPEVEWPNAIEELCSYPHIEEAAVLSTCNRMEVYVVSVAWHRGVREIEEWMLLMSGVSLDNLRPYLFLLRDKDAALHLLRVSAGLDSLVMGEGQILAQVKRVYEVSHECSGFGRGLKGLFKQAITAGKRVRTETGISTGGVSISSAAVELMLIKLPTHKLVDSRISIIGAGKMANLIVKHLLSKGCSEVRILNRSFGRAEALRNEYPECVFDIHLMSRLKDVVAASDVIFVACASENLLLTKDDVAVMPKCPEIVGGIRRFVDISVPRNIDPKLNELEGQSIVYNVDDLKQVVAMNKRERAKEASQADVLLREELGIFEAWRDSLETVPTIKALRAKAESIRVSEVDRTLAKMGIGLSNKQLKAVEELSKSIVNKLLHGPMTSLRCDGRDSDAVGRTLLNMDALERMFSLADFVERMESDFVRED